MSWTTSIRRPSADASPNYVYEATGASADDFTALANRLMGQEVRGVRLVPDIAVSSDGSSGGLATAMLGGVLAGTARVENGK